MTGLNVFLSVRRAGCPLVMVETADATAAMIAMYNLLNGKGEEFAVLKWDMVRGLAGSNKLGQKVADKINNGEDPAIMTGNAVECLRKLDVIPDLAIVFMLGADKIMAEPSVRQAAWNLRDTFKAGGKTLIMLAPLGTKLPTDIKDDFVVIEHDLPDEKRLAEITKTLAKDAEIPPVSEEIVQKAVDASLGLSEFSAEQVIAMSITKQGIQTDSLWDRKRKAIEQTRGLSVYRGGEKFNDIGGCDNAKNFFSRLIKGKRAARCIVFIDEIEKALGSQQDTSGTSQEMLGTVLRWMQDKNVTGCILIGPPGAAKSAIAKATGNEAEVPTVEFDLTAMKGSLVGESSANLRGAIATVDAIGQGKTMVIATCNSIGNLPPELRRRFTLGTFFFDLPTASEREAIWKIYLKKYDRKENEKLPDHEGWTGAEIKQCADVADRLGISLVEGANYVVPVSKSASEQIENLRRQASGRFLSASYSGTYEYQTVQAPTGARRVSVE